MAGDEYPTEKCRSCDAEVIWARTSAGKSMPVDAEPVPGGNVLIERIQGFLRATVVGAVMQAEMSADLRASLRRSHFVTCPDRDKWRKL